MKGLAHNAVWNIASGISSALLTVIMPPVLVRVLDVDSFSAWALSLQLATYVNVINLGMQVVIGRQVAASNALGDRAARDTVVTTAVALLAAIGVIELCVMALVAAGVSTIFPAAPIALHGTIAATILLLALSFAIQLPASVFGAVFIGLQRNDIYGRGMIALRVATLALTVAAAVALRSIFAMSVAWLAATILGSAYIFFLWWRLSPEPHLARSLVSFDRARRIVADIMPFLLWNVSFLMVSGLQVAIVARVDYKAVGAFAVAAGLATFVPGVMQAICGTLIARTAHLIALREQGGVERSLRAVTLASVLLSTAMSGALIAGADTIMRIWLGPLYSPQASMVLAILVFAQAVRNAPMAYVFTAVACRLERRMLAIPLAEGVIALVSSILLGHYFGALGVAAGMIVGALFSLTAQLVQNVLRHALPGFAMRSYLVDEIVRPGIALVPVFGAFVLLHLREPVGILGSIALLSAGTALTLLLLGRRLRALPGLIRRITPD